MSAGTLDQRIRIEQKSDTDDSTGGQTVVWSTLDTVWASIVPDSAEGNAKEELSAHKLRATSRYQVSLRNRADLDATMRVIWLSNGNAVLNIREMPYPGDRALLRHLIVEEGVAT